MYEQLRKWGWSRKCQLNRGSRSNFRGNGYGRRGRSGYGRRGNHYGGQNSFTQQPVPQGGNCFHVEVNVLCNNENAQVPAVDNNLIVWLLDSGCSRHIINNESYFSSCTNLDKSVDVKLGDGRQLLGTKIGSVRVWFKVGKNSTFVDIRQVLYVKGMNANLLSSGKITDNNVIINHGNVAKIFNTQDELIAVAHKRENNLYYLESYKDCQTSNNVNSVSEANVISTNSMSQKEKWHRMLGHVSFSKLKFLCENELLDGAPKRLEAENFKCAICLEFKMNNVPFKDDREKATEILQIVHTDVNGPHSLGYCGEQYFVTFIDDFSKLVKVYCIKSKSEVYNCLVEYVNLVENLTGKRIKELRCDNGTEYINKRVDEFVKNRGIYLRSCVPYVHELNGTAERYNRTLMDRARCLLAEAKVARRFWPKCVTAAAYLTNRTLGNTVVKKTPFEIFFNKKPDVTNLKLYGCRMFTRVPDARRKTKWDRKADCGILLGYTDLGYRVLVNNRVIVT